MISLLDVRKSHTTSTLITDVLHVKKGAYSGRRKILVEFNKEKVEDVDSKYNSLGNQGDKETAESFSTLRYTKEPLLVEGRLDVGIKVDESNYKTMFRLYDATFTPI